MPSDEIDILDNLLSEKTAVTQQILSGQLDTRNAVQRLQLQRMKAQRDLQLAGQKSRIEQAKLKLQERKLKDQAQEQEVPIEELFPQPVPPTGLSKNAGLETVSGEGLAAGISSMVSGGGAARSGGVSVPGGATQQQPVPQVGGPGGQPAPVQGGGGAAPAGLPSGVQQGEPNVPQMKFIEGPDGQVYRVAIQPMGIGAVALRKLVGAKTGPFVSGIAQDPGQTRARDAEQRAIERFNTLQAATTRRDQRGTLELARKLSTEFGGDPGPAIAMAQAANAGRFDEARDIALQQGGMRSARKAQQEERKLTAQAAKEEQLAVKAQADKVSSQLGLDIQQDKAEQAIVSMEQRRQFALDTPVWFGAASPSPRGMPSEQVRLFQQQTDALISGAVKDGEVDASKLASAQDRLYHTDQFLVSGKREGSGFFGTGGADSPTTKVSGDRFYTVLALAAGDKFGLDVQAPDELRTRARATAQAWGVLDDDGNLVKSANDGLQQVRDSQFQGLQRMSTKRKVGDQIVNPLDARINQTLEQYNRQRAEHGDAAGQRVLDALLEP